jgi:formylglycine-generating enzyme required for sulfatase activity
MSTPSRTVLIVALATAVVGVAVLAAKQNPVRYTEVDPSVEPILPEMVRIPEGPFLRGNPTGTDEEKPVRTIWLSEFSIGRYEVTNAEWKRFVDATDRERPVNPIFAEGYDYYLERPDHPAVEISWSDAAAYCKWLSDKTGRDFHLPTEAQWEKAARGGLEGAEFFWGNDRREGMARHALSWSEGPVAVGSYPPNGYGLHDVAGNVNEMVQDWYDETYFARAPERDPIGPNGWLNYVSLLDPVGRSRTKGRCHVVRGGSYRAPWNWRERNPDDMFETPVQVGAREYVYQAPYTHFDLGFRVAEGGVWR